MHKFLFYNKHYKTRICALSWSVTKIILRCTVNKTQKKKATIYSLFKSVNCSTCFGWYLHPSSGAHITVITVSGIIETVTATCRGRHAHDR